MSDSPARGGNAAAAPAAATPALPPALVIKPRAPAQRSVLIINTGGTIGMKRNAAGSLEPCPGYLAERLTDIAEFARPEMPATSLVELLPLLDSSDMGPDDWDRIARAVESAYWEHDGFVVVMGTDTMAYAASALSFMLENLGKPVVVTGSMLPLSDLFNDAQRNLIVSVVIAGMLAVPEVCVFMDARLMRGNRTVKTNSDGLDAFDSPNAPALATLETGIRLRAGLVLPPPKGRFRVHAGLEKNVAVWRMIPGFSDEYILNAIAHTTNLRAIVLELCGGGGGGGGGPRGPPRRRARARARGSRANPPAPLAPPAPAPAPAPPAGTARATFRRASSRSSTRCGWRWPRAWSSSRCRSACAGAWTCARTSLAASSRRSASSARATRRRRPSSQSSRFCSRGPTPARSRCGTTWRSRCAAS